MLRHNTGQNALHPARPRRFLVLLLASSLAHACTGVEEDDDEYDPYLSANGALTIADYDRPVKDCSGVDARTIAESLKIFPDWHPTYTDFPERLRKAKATTTLVMHIPVAVKIDTAHWKVDVVKAYLSLVNRYYRAANIVFDFAYSTTFDFSSGAILSRQFAKGTQAQIRLIFSENVTSPGGVVPDAFGSLPLGTAVMNKQIMNRPDLHALPFFNPVKPIGHELGHVLGLAHFGADGTSNLMAQATSETNGLVLTKPQIVIMRFMAQHRYLGDPVPVK